MDVAPAFACSAAARAACVACAALALALATLFGRSRVAGASRDRHRRGTLVRVPRGPGLRRRRSRGLAGRSPRRTAATALRLGGIGLAAEDETRHFKLIGATGAGKSTAIAALLRGALSRGDRAVIADPNSAYHERFFDRFRGDVVLNPFEPLSVRWDLFREARRAYDYEELARALVADTDDKAGREWRGYARTLIAAVARGCAECGERDVATLWRLIASADAGELRCRVAGTPAQPFLDADNARMFGSIRSVACSALSALQYIGAQRGQAFSVRDWVARGSGVLFIPYRASQIAALRAIIATWMRLAIFETLSGPEISRCGPEIEPRGAADARGRLWLVVDELDALGAIDGLKDALARLRKFGGRCVLGFQSIAQVSSSYGAGEAQTIVENCGNTLILRCSGSERGGTSAFASRLIGERELVRRQTSRGREAGGLLAGPAGRRSTQVTQQRVTEAAVLPSEIEQLPDLAGYLKTASAPHWTLVRLAPDAGPWPSSIWA